MKHFIYTILLLLPFSMQAQDSTKTAAKDTAKTAPKDTTGWKRGGVAGLNFSQTSLTNWASGGENSIAITNYLSLYANYKKEHTTWDNTLDLAYGLVQQGSQTLRKSDDKIDFSSKYGHYAFKKVYYYSALLGFKSQFAPGFSYSSDGSSSWISDFASPAYGLLAAGLDYKPNAGFSMMLSPITCKMTMVMAPTLADAGAFGVTKAIRDAQGNKIKDGENFRFEIGGYFKATLRKDIMKNVNLQSKLELFSNYAFNPAIIDVNWENLVSMKVNKFISAGISTQLIYDQDVAVPVDRNDDGINDGTGPRVQFKEVFGIGFSAKF
ncbi:MAG: hypothetical protein FD123_2043 [Bacteroidetes bacterium]|nr:MAG: hypothetical protein FD123_2043 [Bacteroidota bacterium]